MKIFTRFVSILAVMLVFPMLSSAQNVPVESIQILRSNKPVTEGKLAVGGSVTFTAKILPENATTKTVTWSISDSKVATLEPSTAKVRGMVPGVTVISAEADGVKATYTLTVQQKDAKVGDYFFSDNTWEAGGIVAGKTCIGVIFYLNADKRSGKIVSLDEAETLKWSLAEVASPGAIDELNGLANLAKIQAVDGWKEKFDAEAWCVAKSEGNLKWYLPAIDELRQLFAASCGLTWVESGADESKKEINNWTGNSVTMLPGDNIDPYPTERATFNKKFTNIGATALAADKYWSSTQYAEDFAQFLSFEGGYSNSQPKQYFHVCRTRAIAEFSENKATTGIDDIPASKACKMAIYPNPAVADATITTASEIAAVNLYSLNGAEIAVKADINGDTATLNVSVLPAGTYIVTATCTDGSRQVAKLLKR